MRPIPQEQVRLYLLEAAAGQHAVVAVKARGRLAAQLTSGAVMRVQAEIDRLYDDLRAADAALPTFVGPIIEVTGFAADTACYVSLPDDADTLDVAPFGPRGFSEPPHEAPENSRRLFRYDKADVVNPKSPEGGR